MALYTVDRISFLELKIRELKELYKYSNNVEPFLEILKLYINNSVFVQHLENAFISVITDLLDNKWVPSKKEMNKIIMVKLTKIHNLHPDKILIFDTNIIDKIILLILDYGYLLSIEELALCAFYQRKILTPTILESFDITPYMFRQLFDFRNITYSPENVTLFKKYLDIKLFVDLYRFYINQPRLTIDIDYSKFLELLDELDIKNKILVTKQDIEKFNCQELNIYFGFD